MGGSIAFLLAASVWTAVPPWALSGQSPNHPPALWVVGAGSSTESIDLARQAAMADVVRQVRARVKSTSEDEHWEASSSTAGRSQGERSWTGAKVQASEEVAGIQIAETAQDGPTWYALAVLDRSAFAAPGRTAMREAQADGQERLIASTLALTKHRPLDALDALRLVEIDRSKFNQGRERAALGEPDALRESFSISNSTTDSLKREVARGLELRRRLDSIEVGPDKIWPASAGLSVRFRGTPVAGVDVDLVGPNGQILGTDRTDTLGIATVKPSTIPTSLSTGWMRWSLRPRLNLQPAAELGLVVRRVGSSALVRLDWVPGTIEEEQTLVKNRLADAGWSIDKIHGTPLKAQLVTKPKGEIEGFSETLHRVEVKLVLSRKASRCELIGVGTGTTDDRAIENAIQKLSLPSETLRDLLSEN